MSRITQALRAFFSILFRGKLPDALIVELGLTRRVAPASAAAQKTGAASSAPTPADGAVQLLALLQSESRLVDFLMEDIAGFSDEQVGAAVRDLHEHSRAVLRRHISLSPVIDGVEGAVTSLASTDAAPGAGNVKLIGKVPPDGKADAGILRHRGWKAERIDLPALRPGKPVRIVAPAEIEIE